MPIVIAVRFLVQEGAGDAFRDVLLRLTEHSRAEDGCIAYLPFRDPADPAVFFLLEHWANREALDRHRGTPFFAKWAGIELRKALVRSEPLFLEPLE